MQKRKTEWNNWRQIAEQFGCEPKQETSYRTILPRWCMYAHTGFVVRQNKKSLLSTILHIPWVYMIGWKIHEQSLYMYTLMYPAQFCCVVQLKDIIGYIGYLNKDTIMHLAMLAYFASKHCWISKVLWIWTTSKCLKTLYFL
jgi:hypothetical protein